MRAESRDAERFWIAYAPENHASGAGIAKAGFVALAEMSFDADGRPALQRDGAWWRRRASRVLGLPRIGGAARAVLALRASRARRDVVRA